LSWVAAGAAVVTAGVGIYKSVKSAKQEKDAKRQAALLNQPKYQIQPEYSQNKNIAAGLAGQGFTSSAKDYLTTENQRGLSTGIGAIESLGGGASDISKLYGAYSRSVSNTAAKDSEVQLQNIQNFMQANKEYAGQKNMAWSLNDDRTYQNKMKELKMAQQIADQNKWEGINSTVSSISALGTSMSNANLLKGTNRIAGTPRGSDYVASQPVQAESAYQGITPSIQGRNSPNIAQNNNNNSYGDYSGFEADRNEWGSIYNTVQ